MIGTPDFETILRVLCADMPTRKIIRAAEIFEERARNLEQANPEAAATWNPDRLASATYLRKFAAERNGA